MQAMAERRRARPWDAYADELEALSRREAEISLDGDLVAHENGVARTTRALAAAAGLPRDEVERMTVAARYHDVGKTRIRPEVLNKPGLLDDDERAHMEEHGRHGAEILSAIPGMDPMMVEVARYHHERYDGNGYEGLAGEDIPLAARIVSIADVHDALGAKRAYKPAMPEGRVLAIMIEDNGSAKAGHPAFDPALLRTFVAMRLADPAFQRLEDERLRRVGGDDPRPGLAAFAGSPVPERDAPSAPRPR